MARKRNDSLRELLEFTKGQILTSHPDTQGLEGVSDLIEPLTIAIQDLKDHPGPSQEIGG